MFILGVLVAWIAEWLFFNFYFKDKYCNRAMPAAATSTDTATSSDLAALKTEKAKLDTEIADLKKTAASHKDEQAASASKLTKSETRISELETALSSKVEELDNTVNADENQADAISAESSEAENNLATISGIGPTLHEALNDLDIRSFNQLITADIEKLMTNLKEKGARFNKANAQTWAQQATLAAQGDWGGLKALQAELKA
jgi:predicted flap endonuclease-1-like 5' DNA nuclease